MGQLGRFDEIPLQPQLVLEPFDRWALDFAGPINPSSYSKVYLWTYIDYVTKWVEAKALEKAIEQVVSNFMFEEFFFITTYHMK